MAGLSVLLETQTSFPKQAQILSKTSFLKNASLTSSSAGAAASTHESTFLEQCYLCRIKLLLGEDIYMYRSETKGFLSYTVCLGCSWIKTPLFSLSLSKEFYLAGCIVAEGTEPSAARSVGVGI